MSNLAKLKKKAAAFEQNRQFDKALAVYEDVLRAQDGSEEADIALYNRVGDLQARQGRGAEALRSYEQAADLYAERGFQNNAIALYNKVLRQNPAHADVQLKLGRLSASKGFRSDARRHFAAYVTLMKRGGRVDDAFGAIRGFADSAEDGDEVREVLAELLAEHERVPEAVDELRAVLASCERQHRHGDARALLERIRVLDPTFSGEATSGHFGADGDIELGSTGESLVPRPDAAPRGQAARSGSSQDLVLFDPADGVYGAAADRARTPVESMAHSLLDVDEPAGHSAAERSADASAAEALGAALEMQELEVLGGAPAAEGYAAVETERLDGFTPTADGVELDGDAGGTQVGMPEDLVRGAEFVSAEFTAPADAGEAGTIAGLMVDEPHDPYMASRADAESLLEEPEPVGAVQASADGAAVAELEIFLPESVTEATEAAVAADAPAVTDDGWLVVHDGDAADEPAPEPESALTFYSPDDEVPAADVAPAHAPMSTPAVPRLSLVVDDDTADDAIGETAMEVAVADAAPSPPRSEPAVSDDALLDFSRQLDADVPRPWNEPTPAPSSDFINLGDWLRADDAPRTTRMITEERAPSGDEQADFVEMLRKFKQGVADNVGHEDYDSHYDLGVAFKEMGLVDEAIAAFQKALRGPSNRTRVYEALGQCFLDRGQHTIASSVLQRAITEPGADDQLLVGVLYLLGRAAEALHQKPEALRYYQRVFAVDIEFSDVAQRIGLVEQVSQ